MMDNAGISSLQEQAQADPYASLLESYQAQINAINDSYLERQKKQEELLAEHGRLMGEGNVSLSEGLVSAIPVLAGLLSKKDMTAYGAAGQAMLEQAEKQGPSTESAIKSRERVIEQGGDQLTLLKQQQAKIEEALRSMNIKKIERTDSLNKDIASMVNRNNLAEWQNNEQNKRTNASLAQQAMFQRANLSANLGEPQAKALLGGGGGSVGVPTTSKEKATLSPSTTGDVYASPTQPGTIEKQEEPFFTPWDTSKSKKENQDNIASAEMRKSVYSELIPKGANRDYSDASFSAIKEATVERLKTAHVPKLGERLESNRNGLKIVTPEYFPVDGNRTPLGDHWNVAIASPDIRSTVKLTHAQEAIRNIGNRLDGLIKSQKIRSLDDPDARQIINDAIVAVKEEKNMGAALTGIERELVLSLLNIEPGYWELPGDPLKTAVSRLRTASKGLDDKKILERLSSALQMEGDMAQKKVDMQYRQYGLAVNPLSRYLGVSGHLDQISPSAMGRAIDSDGRVVLSNKKLEEIGKAMISKSGLSGYEKIKRLTSGDSPLYTKEELGLDIPVVYGDTKTTIGELLELFDKERRSKISGGAK